MNISLKSLPLMELASAIYLILATGGRLC